MAEIIATFADGRLLVQESRLVESRYMGSGVPVRIGHLKVVEKVLSVDSEHSPYGLITRLSEVRVGTTGATISGSLAERTDHIRVMMRRGDIVDYRDVLQGGSMASGTASGLLASISGAVGRGMLSGITSGVGWVSEILSGNINISGVVRIIANVIGY